MKDHEIAKLVNTLTEIAKVYGQTQQLRSRISVAVTDAINKSLNIVAYSHLKSTDFDPEFTISGVIYGRPPKKCSHGVILGNHCSKCLKRFNESVFDI